MRFSVTPSDNKSWAGFGNVSVLRQWAEELREMQVSECDSTLWRMIGRFVMVAYPIQSKRKSLLALVAEEAGLEFLEMEGSALIELVMHGQTPSLEKPTLIFIELGEWSTKTGDEKPATSEITEFRTKLSPYLASLDPACKLVFVTTGDSYNEIDPSLRKAGCIDRRLIISKPTLEETGNAFIDLVGRKICGESLQNDPAKVGKLIFEEFDDERRQGLIAVGMERTAYRERRQVEFSDLVHFAIHGSGEGEPTPEIDKEMLRRVAVHEAGHALVCFLDSNGRNIPDYISIMPGHQFRGVVADSYGYMESLHGKYTYEDSRHKIRSTLAGRAAEAVVFGPTKVGSFGARADLVNASTWAKELVGACGFPEDIDTAPCISSNLLVNDEELSQSEQEHSETLAREYLKIQFEYVTKLLAENRSLMDLIVGKLMKNPVLFREDLLGVLPTNCANLQQISQKPLDINY